MAKIAVSWIITLVASLMCAVPASSEPSVLRRHSLAIDDVLDTVAIERAVYSPDGAWVAAVVQRPARSGEVYGRTAYEIDPSRNDIWLISTRTGERRNLTEGQSSASGFWCPAWSPDGKRLAMLSTKPEGAEPRGGDNVRLYLWDIATEEMTRLSQQALITQTRMGSPLHALDMRSTGVAGGSTQVCLEDDENAPGLSGFPCVAGHNGQQGVPLCHDAKNLPYRMSFSISFWRAALPVPPSSRAVCSIR